jgi:hypothetical protein
MLRVYREPVELTMLQDNCTDLSQLSLQLYTQTTMEGESSVYTLRGTQSLSQTNYTVGGWVEFLNLTSMYKSLIDSIHEELEDGAIATAVFNTRLTVNSPSCSNLSPSALGFVSLADHRAQLVGFEDNSIEDKVSFSDMMSLVARSRRQAELAVLATEPPSNETMATINSEPAQNLPLENPGDYELSRCQLYTYDVSRAIRSLSTTKKTS